MRAAGGFRSSQPNKLFPLFNFCFELMLSMSTNDATNVPISVTVFCLSIEGVPKILQHTFFALPIHSISVLTPALPTHIPEPSSLALSLLLPAIAEVMWKEGTKMPPRLHDILAMAVILNNIRISTTRIGAVFDHLSLLLPEHGYHALGFWQDLIISEHTIDSIDLTTPLLDMQRFKNCLLVQGAALSHHFILTLAVDPPTDPKPSSADYSTQFTSLSDFLNPMSPFLITNQDPALSYDPDHGRLVGSPFCEFPGRRQDLRLIIPR